MDEALLFRELIDGVNDAWQTLDGHSKRILELKYVLEKSDSELAEELDIKVGSVRMTLTRARNALKMKMKEAEMI